MAIPPCSPNQTGTHELRLLTPESRIGVRLGLGGAATVHAVLLLLVVLLAWGRAEPPVASRLPDLELVDLVWLPVPDAGGGGGGGGDLRPEPPRKEPVAAVKPPDPLPEAVPEPVQPPDPVLAAELPVVPVDALPALMASATAVTPSLGPASDRGAGPGAQGGIGSGERNGLGDSNGPGSGHDAGPGGSLSQPELVYSSRPRYTEAAMVHHVEGQVILECVALATGAVGDCTIVRPLDSNQYGLDAEALKAAKQFRFKPAMRGDMPVPVLIRIELAFSVR